MGKFSGPYTLTGKASVFEEARNWVGFLLTKGSPVVDVVINLLTDALYTRVRRHTQTFVGPVGTPFGLVHVEAGTALGDVNNLKITGGDGTLVDGVVTGDGTTGYESEGPGRFFVGGHVALFPADREWLDNTVTLPPIHSYTTVITGDVLTDSAAFFEVEGDVVVGRICYPDISLRNDDTGVAPLGFPVLDVLDQTQLVLDVSDPKNADGSDYTGTSSFTTLADYDVVAGKQYRLSLTPPDSGSRIDTVVLDVYLDEVSGDDDPVLLRIVEGTQTRGGNALKVAQRIEVVQGVNLTTDVTAGYDVTAPVYYRRRTDVDGNMHHRVVLATLTRSASPDPISAGDITAYNDDEMFNASFSLLPPTSDDTSIEQTTVNVAWNTIGSILSPGTWQGSTIEFSRFLLQMLGNVTVAQNVAFQNMGIYSDASGDARRLTPGKGNTSSSGHVALLTNSEEGSLRSAYPATGAAQQVSALTPGNPPVSVSGHNDSIGLGTVTSAAKHCIVSGTVPDHATSANVTGPSGGDLTGASVQFADNPVFVLGSSGSLVARGLGLWYYAAGLGGSVNRTFKIFVEGINCTAYATKAELQADYAVVVEAHHEGNFNADDEGQLVSVDDWSLEADPYDGVNKIRVWFTGYTQNSGGSPAESWSVSATCVAR